MIKRTPSDKPEDDPAALDVVICDDHLAVREGLVNILSEAGFEVSGACASIKELIHLVQEFPKAVVFTDLGVDNVTFPDLVAQVRVHSSDNPIVVYSARDTPVTMGLCYELGAVAFVPKTASREDIVNAMEYAERGERYYPSSVASAVIRLSTDRQAIISSLSPREMEIFLAYCREMSIEEIATKLGVTDKTVQNALSQISKKLDAPRSTFREIAKRHGFLEY